MMKTTLLATVTTLLIAGCAQNPYYGDTAKTARGATIGAGAGAVLGSVVSGSGARTKGGLIGAALGATVGSIVPVLGTGIGAAVGGGLGLAWEGIKDLLKPAEQKPVDVNAKMTVGLAPGLVLQGQSVQASGGNVQMNTGNLFTGAPG